MKSSSLKRLAALVGLLLAGYPASAAPRSGTAIVAGHVRFTDTYTTHREVSFNFNSLFRDADERCRIVSLDSAGAFRIEIPLDYPQEVRLDGTGISLPLYLSPDDSVFVDIDPRVVSEPGYAGFLTLGGTQGAEISRRMLAYRQSVSLQRYGPAQMDEAIATKSPMEYAEFIDQREADCRAALNACRTADPQASSFRSWAEDDLRYTTYVCKADYPVVHEIYNGRPGKRCEVPDGYYDFIEAYDGGDLQTVTMNHARFLDAYAQYIREKTEKELHRGPAPRSLGEALTRYQKELSARMKGFGGSFCYARMYLDVWLPKIPPDTLDRYLAPVRLDPLVERKIAERRQRTERAVSEPLPGGIHLASVGSSIGEGVFDSIVAPYRGKVVYVDFWSPACVPCLAQMPFSEKLEKSYAGKEVVFLFICGGTPDDVWRRTVAAKKMGGVHYNPTYEQIRLIYAKFGIRGIPRYMVIDREGRIVSDNAPRPSNREEAAQCIDPLL